MTPVPAMLRDGPPGQPVTLLLAHGANEPMDSPLLTRLATGLARDGIAVARFELPYMARRRETGRRAPPDRMPVLLAAYREAVEALGGGPRVIVGGRSLGGRVASMVADEVDARGALLISYPFHPPRRPDDLRTAHLATLRTRTRIVHGDRDPLGSPDEIARYPLSPAIEVCFVADADHSIGTRKRSGRSFEDAVVDTVRLAGEFIHSVAGIH